LIELDRFVLKNFHLFKHFDWKISDSSLWVIRGRNLDALKSGKEISGNALGKSMIPNALGTLWLAQPPFSNRKNSAKELVPGKASAILYGRSNKESFVIEQRNGKKLDYTIKRKGKQLDIKDISNQRATIQDILPLNEHHFYSQVYIHSFRPSILQIGSSSQRYDFIESIFNLRIYDAINKQLLKLASTQKYERMRLPQLQSDKKDIKITPKQQKELQNRLFTLQKKLQERISKLEIYNTKLQKSSKLITLFDMRKSTQSKGILKEERDKAEAELKKIDKDIANYNRLLGKQEANQQAIQKRTELLSNKATTLRYIKKMSQFTQQDYDKAIERLSILQELTQLAKNHAQEIFAYKHFNRDKIIKSAMSLIKDNNEKVNNLIGKLTDELEYELNIFGSKATLVEDLEKLKEHRNCPTCLQTISKVSLDEIIKQARIDLETSSNNLGILRKARMFVRMEKELPYELLHGQESEWTNERENLEFLIGDMAAYLELNEKLLNIDKQLKTLPKTTDIHVSKLDMKKLEIKKKKLVDRIQFITSELVVLNRLDRNYTKEEIDNIKQRHKNYQSTVTSLSDNLLPLNEKVNELSVAVNTGKIGLSTLSKLKEEIAEIENNTKDYELIEALIEIYSPKGVRIQHISTLVDSYITLMNQYSTTIFSEPIKFSSKIGNRQFAIMAERRGTVSDVNSLSGAESRQFLALSALIFRMLTPQEFRSNTMILDELEAGMSKVNRNLFFSQFVPLLQQHVPVIVIITPHDASYVNLPTATQLMLTKKNNFTSAKVGV
jgi:DNA repair exonuclease SbcCD ATPase subunit